MKKHLIIVAAALLMIPTVSSACDGKGSKGATCMSKSAHGSGHGPSGHHAIPGKSPGHIRMMLKSADRIGLSKKQRKQIGELLVEAESGVAKAHAEAEVTVAEFRSRLHAGSVTDKEVDAYTKKMGQLRSASLAANLKASVAASRLLTDEQKSKLYSKKSMGGAK